MKRRIVDIMYEKELCFKDDKGYFIRYKENSIVFNPDKKNPTKENKTIVKYINEDLMIEEKIKRTPLSSLGHRVGLNILLLPDYKDNDFCNKRQSCTDNDLFESILLRLANDNLKPVSDVHIWFEHKIEDGKDILLKRSMCLVE